MYSSTRHVLLTAFSCLVGLSLSSCGSGGNDGIPVAAANQTIVSGTVQAPGGQIASFKKPDFSNWFVSEAYAALIGLSNVIDGTPVELGRISNTTPFTFSPIASTHTSGGRYSFNLTSLGLNPDPSLVVRVKSGAIEMRAFVTGSVIDLNPLTEAVTQVVFQKLGVQQLNQLTVDELSDITGAANILANLSIEVAGNIQQTVETFKTMITANSPLTAFISAAASPGPTNQAVGDIGNFFPYSQGNSWEYKKTRSTTGSAPQTYTNIHSVLSGVRPMNGVDTLTLRESNPENSMAFEDNFFLKTLHGIVVHGSEPTDSITPQIVPYQAIRFPLSDHSKYFALANRRISVSGSAVDLTVEVEVVGFESVTVPSGTYPKALKMVSTQVATLARKPAVRVAGIETTWLVSNVGPVKSVQELIENGTTTQTDVEELTHAAVDGREHVPATVRKIGLATNNLVYDQFSQRIYASTPGNPGRITQIDPVTGALGPSITIGNQPNKLAVSDDGQYLYVSLDGESSVRRIHLPSFTPDITLQLGSDPAWPPTTSCNPLAVFDMEPLPGNSTAVAISKRYTACSPPFYELAIYDNAVQRPNTATRLNSGGLLLSDIIEFSDSATTFYGYDTSTTANQLTTFSLSPLGVTVNNSAGVPSGVFMKELYFAGNRLYSNTGHIINPSSPDLILRFQNFPTFPIFIVRPDAGLGRVFFMPDSVISGGTVSILAYDMTTLRLIGVIDIHGFGPGTDFASATNLIRWGNNGLAFRTNYGEVFLVQSSLVQ